MRSFRCACGNRLYFENDRCLDCGRALAFDPSRMEVRAVEAGDRLCAHHADPGTCNWLLDIDNARYCRACSLNQVIPDLSDARRVRLYYEVEKAKRRLIFTLICLGLPVEGRAQRQDGLAFRILADARLDEDDATLAAYGEVTTGHAQGEITINLLEADPRLREGMRVAMNESYRTLLGHFRHESGHYYWQRLVALGDDLGDFRSRFGDERRQYQDSLDAYYREGAAGRLAPGVRRRLRRQPPAGGLRGVLEPLPAHGGHTANRRRSRLQRGRPSHHGPIARDLALRAHRRPMASTGSGHERPEP